MSPAPRSTRRPTRLWVVDPSVATPEEQGVGEVLEGFCGEPRVFLPGLRPGDGPDATTGYATDGVVVLGSAASVHDLHGWLASLGDWLRPLILGQVQIPVLGICFGHQLVAHLAGGRVGYRRADASKLLGVERTRLEGGRLLPGKCELRVVVSHREEVQRLPAGFRVVAHRPGSAMDGIEHGHLDVFSFQFHPEAREEFAERSGIDPGSIDERVREDGRRLLRAFRELVEKKKKPATG